MAMSNTERKKIERAIAKVMKRFHDKQDQMLSGESDWEKKLERWAREIPELDEALEAEDVRIVKEGHKSFLAIDE